MHLETLLTRSSKSTFGWNIARRHFTIPVLAVVLLAEILVLTLRFDGQSLVDRGPWWGRFAAYARYLPQALMAVSVAALVFGGSRWRELWREDGMISSSSRLGRSLGYFAAHLAAFGVLVALTAAVWEGPAGESPQAAWWLLGWLLTVVATFAFLLAVVLPAERWALLARRSAGVLAVAVVVGATGCGAGWLTSGLWTPLAAATLWLVRLMLGLGFRDVVCNPDEHVVGTSRFVVEVAPSCSGFEGIGLIWVFLLAYLWIFRRELRFPRAFWLLPIGTMVMWLANAARIALLIVIGTTISPTVALGGFHSQAGWLAFNAVALGLVGLTRRAGLFATASDEDAPTLAQANPTAAYLGPLMALMGAMMITTAMSAGGGFDGLYPVRVLAVAVALWLGRRGRVEGLWSWSWAGAGIGVVVFAIWMGLESFARPTGAPSELADGLNRLSPGLAAVWLVFRVIGSVVTVPIAEELAFRGYLTRRLMAADFTTVTPGSFSWTSFLGSSFLFGLLHGRLLAGAIAGLLFALAYYRRGRLGDAVLAHAVTNGLIAAYVLATGSWSLWM